MRKLLLAVIALAAILGSSCSNADPSSDFARYRVSVAAPASQIASKPGENGPARGVVNGTLEVAVADESACLTLTGLRFTEARLTAQGNVVATFLLSDSEGGNICNEASAEDLRDVLDHPDEHQLSVELVDGTIIESDLAS